MALKDHWGIGTGWKVTIAATTAAMIGGAALASPGIGGISLPAIDLDDLVVITTDDPTVGPLQIVPTQTVTYDLDSTFLSTADEAEASLASALDSSEASYASALDSLDESDDDSALDSSEASYASALDSLDESDDDSVDESDDDSVDQSDDDSDDDSV